MDEKTRANRFCKFVSSGRPVQVASITHVLFLYVAHAWSILKSLEKMFILKWRICPGLIINLGREHCDLK